MLPSLPFARVQDFIDNAPRRALSDDEWDKYPKWSISVQYDINLHAKDSQMLDDIVHDLSLALTAKARGKAEATLRLPPPLPLPPSAPLTICTVRACPSARLRLRMCVRLA